MVSKASSVSRFDFHAAIERAQSILRGPPAREFITRPTLLAHVVFRAAIPAELCQEANAMARRAMGASWRHAEIKSELWKHLSSQALLWTKYRRYWPFDVEASVGRPQVIAVKFSSHPNDAGSNPGKAAIDMLTSTKLLDEKKRRYTKHRLGIITDDRRSTVDQLHWWEFQAQKYPAIVLIEVRV